MLSRPVALWKRQNVAMDISRHFSRFSSSLRTTGYAWAILSLMAAATAAFGFYMPYWLRGELTLYHETAPAHFSSFRRCNYPATVRTADAVVNSVQEAVPGCSRCQLETSPYRTGDSVFRQVLVAQCGRYASFDDIPTLWWKITTVVVGTGAGIAVVMGLITLPAFCTRDIITRTTARMIGIFQILAAMLIIVGCLLYPLGWGNKETKEACGRDAGPFKLGDCSVGFAYVVLCTSSVMLLVCAALSASAANRFEWYRADEKANAGPDASVSL